MTAPALTVDQVAALADGGLLYGQPAIEASDETVLRVLQHARDLVEGPSLWPTTVMALAFELGRRHPR